MSKLVYGEGKYSSGKYVSHTTIEGRHCKTKEYSHWTSMLGRCYSTKQTTGYIGCTVSENFKNFQYFAEWCNNQFGFGEKGYHLDKDILLKDNKVYSEDTCCFVPKRINYLVLNKRWNRGEYPMGVCYDKTAKRFKANITANNKTINIGNYKTPIEAFLAYKEVKEAFIREVAENYKALISEQVYYSLINWEISVDD